MCRLIVWAIPQGNSQEGQGGWFGRVSPTRHERPLEQIGDLTPGLDGSGLAHLHCNRSHRGKLGAKRAAADKQQEHQKGKVAF